MLLVLTLFSLGSTGAKSGHNSSPSPSASDSPRHFLTSPNVAPPPMGTFRSRYQGRSDDPADFEPNFLFSPTDSLARGSRTDTDDSRLGLSELDAFGAGMMISRTDRGRTVPWRRSTNASTRVRSPAQDPKTAAGESEEGVDLESQGDGKSKESSTWFVTRHYMLNVLISDESKSHMPSRSRLHMGIMG